MSMRYPGGLIATTPVNQQYPSGVWTGPQTTPYQANNVWANDSSFKNTTLLLHGDGATTSFTRDASTNNFQVSLAGDTKPNNLTPFITNGYWSNLFDGSTSYLNVASNAAFGFGTGDFTVEFFIYPNVTANTWSIYHGTTTNSFIINTTSGGNLVIRQYGVTDLFTSASALTVGSWNHVAVARSGTTISLWLNGSRSSGVTGTNSTNFATTGVYIGRADTVTAIVNGWMSNVRTVKGTAVYDPTQTSITVPTAPLTAVSGTSLLTCQSNRFVDNSSNAFSLTITGSPSVSMQQPFTAPSGTSQYGSGYFDGNGDSITAPANSAFAFGTGDFTYEGWYYSLDTGSSLRGMFDTRITQASTAGVLLREDSSGFLVYINGGTLFTASGRVPNSWQHIALVRQSGTIRLYINGVQANSAANTTNFTDTFCRISGFVDTQASPYGYFGYISNARVIKGTCLYPSGTTFTPSTTPLTPVSGTSLLTLQTNGPENNNGFLDSSPNSFPITRNGNTTQGAFSPYGSSWSGYFGGAGSYMTTPSGSASTIVGTINSSLNLCIECWVYLNEYSGSSSFPALIGNMDPTTESDDWSFGPVSTGALMFYWYDTGQKRAYTTSAIPLNTWTHVAVNISTGVITLFINGVSQTLTGTTTLTTGSVGRNYLTFGQWNNGVSGSYGLFKGYVSNLRVIKASTYTANFTPSTAPLTAVANTSLLMFQSNRFVDNSANAFAITVTGSPSVQRFNPFVPTQQNSPNVIGGSGYFDGSGDSLSSVNTPANFGSNNFTAEAWVWFTSNSGGYKPIMGNTGTADYQGWVLITETNNALAVYASNGGSWAYNIVTSYVPSINCWTHLAYVRNGTTLTLYVNGVSIGTAAISTNSINSPSGAFYAGYYPYFPGGARSLNGYISDLRLVNGTAVYTSAFTPPTAPLTAITNTSLLLNTTNAAIFDNSGMNNLETVGNAQIDTSVVKYGASSMYFDGSGDYLTYASTPNLAYGSGEFTVELWVYLNAAPGGDAGLVDQRPASTNGSYFMLGVDSSRRLFVYVSSAYRIGPTVAINTATWYHVAYVRTSGTGTLYLNGSSIGSWADTTTYAQSSGFIGHHAFNAADFNGYIDDLRITKGVARYVGNFTPPVARMPNQ